jgi:molybdate transport system permease protein
MFQVLRGSRGEKTFWWATISVLAVVVLCLLGLIGAMLTYTDWRTFVSAFLSPEILFAIRLSLISASVATVVAMLIAVPVAYALSRTRFPGKNAVDSLLDLPIVMSPVALGAALLIFFSTPLGANINSHLKFVFAVPGIILAQVIVVNGLAIRLLKSTFDSIDPRYEQVGRTLGCTQPAAFFSITVPLAKDGLIAASILTWARAIGEFGATVTLAGATAMKTETLPIAIYLSLASADIGRAIAVVLILLVISLLALLVIRKVTARRYII